MKIFIRQAPASGTVSNSPYTAMEGDFSLLSNSDQESKLSLSPEITAIPSSLN